MSSSVADGTPLSPIDLRAISRAAVVTALGLILPPLFHALHLGHVFMPMYLPILCGALLLPVRWAAATGAITPLLSCMVTGMPPLMPPVAAWMAVELAVMAALAAWLGQRLSPWWVVPVVLAAGRIIYLALVFVSAGWLDLPPRLFTLTSLLAGWPGMVLALLVVPAATRLARRWGIAR